MSAAITKKPTATYAQQSLSFNELQMLFKN